MIRNPGTLPPPPYLRSIPKNTTFFSASLKQNGKKKKETKTKTKGWLFVVDNDIDP